MNCFHAKYNCAAQLTVFVDCTECVAIHFLIILTSTRGQSGPRGNNWRTERLREHFRHCRDERLMTQWTWLYTLHAIARSITSERALGALSYSVIPAQALDDDGCSIESHVETQTRHGTLGDREGIDSSRSPAGSVGEAGGVLAVDTMPSRPASDSRT
jgi:hypothetical protein